MKINKINERKFRADIHLNEEVNQKKIADELGLTKGTVSSKLRKPGRMPTEEFAVICELLGTQIQDYVLDE